MKRGLSLVRVSTVAQEDGTSLESQEATIEAYSFNNNIVVLDVCRIVYTGVDVMNAPEFVEFLPRIKAGAYDAAVVYEMDRFAREIELSFALKYLFRTHNVEVHFATEKYDDSPEGKIMHALKSYNAEKERLQIRERTMRGKAHKIAQGKLIPCSDLYGYIYNRATGKREIVEPEAVIVKEIFAKKLQGLSAFKIAQSLNERQIVPPSTGKRTYKDGRVAIWNASSVRRIVEEISYTGQTYAYRFRRESYYDNGKKKSRTVRLSSEKWVRLDTDITPPLITEKDFNLCQRIHNVGDVTRNEKREYLLRGRIYCAVCGQKMYCDLENKTRRIYRCSSRRSLRVSKCPGKRVNAEHAEKWTWFVLEKMMADKASLRHEAQFFEKGVETFQKKTQRKILSRQKSIEKLDRELANLVTRSATVDAQTWKLFEKQIKQKQRERIELISIIDELKATLEGERDERDAAEQFINLYKDQMENATFEIKSKVISVLDVKVFANKNDCEVVPRWFNK